MKVLLTGGTGFIGSHVADDLISKGIEVRCLARKTSNLRWLNNKPIEIVEGSLSDVSSLKECVEGVDIVIHSAGLVAAKNEAEFFKANRDGTRNLLEACQKFNPSLKKFVHVSSQTVAGPSESLEKPKTEEMLVEPITAYGRSKKAAEAEVLKFQDKFSVTIVRPSAVYGPRDTATFTMFQTVSKGLAALIGFNTKYVNLVHSSDLTRGIVGAALSENTSGKVYFLASEEIYNWNDIMDAMVKSLGKTNALKLRIPHFIVYTIAGLTEIFGRFSEKPPVFNFDKGRDFVQTYWTCSVENAKRDFGYKQQTTLADGMKITADWYKDNGWL